MGKFAPLALELIDEGRYLKDVNLGIDKIVQAMIQYKKDHGKTAATGVKAELHCKLVLCFDGLDDSDFSVKGTTAVKMPGPPARTTRAIENEEQDGQPHLWVRASGGTNDSPRQAVIATHDGRTVNPATGEILNT